MGTIRAHGTSSIVVIIVGIVLALLVNYILGIIVILIGLAMLLMPMLGGDRRARLARLRQNRGMAPWKLP